MALVEEISLRLASMETGAKRARDLASAGESSAQTIAGRMAAAGFTGISLSVDGVRSAIGDLAGALAAMRARIRGIQRRVAALPGYLVPARAEPVLVSLVLQTAEADAAIRGCLLRVSEVARQTARALDGGQPGPMLARLNAIGQIIAVVHVHGIAARDSVDATLNEVRRAGRLDSHLPDGGAPSHRSSAAAPPDPSEPAPYRMGHLERLPVRLRDDAPTHGVLTTTDGSTRWDVRSGQRGPATGAPGLRPPFDRYVSALDHAESHAAAIIRDRRLAEATLYLNNPPCDTPLGCHRVLPYVLPAGAKLTVYGPGGYRKVYQGNGKGLA